MAKYKLRNILFTGFIALLPISLFLLVLSWLYRIIAGVVAPFTRFYGTPEIVTILIVLVIVFIIIFLVGIVALTKVGKNILAYVDRYVFDYLPGYKMIKQMLGPFMGKQFKKSFKSVALVDLWDNGTLMTAFVTDSSDSYVTIFVPTGPNPTSGNIYHIPEKRVYFVDVKVESVLQTVISVGAGSSKLIKKLDKKKMKR